MNPNKYNLNSWLLSSPCVNFTWLKEGAGKPLLDRNSPSLPGRGEWGVTQLGSLSSPIFSLPGLLAAGGIYTLPSVSTLHCPIIKLEPILRNLSVTEKVLIEHDLTGVNLQLLLPPNTQGRRQVYVPPFFLNTIRQESTIVGKFVDSSNSGSWDEYVIRTSGAEVLLTLMQWEDLPPIPENVISLGQYCNFLNLHVSNE